MIWRIPPGRKLRKKRNRIKCKDIKTIHDANQIFTMNNNNNNGSVGHEIFELRVEVFRVARFYFRCLYFDAAAQALFILKYCRCACLWGAVKGAKELNRMKWPKNWKFVPISFPSMCITWFGFCMVINPWSPNIQIQILQIDLKYISLKNT